MKEYLKMNIHQVSLSYKGVVPELAARNHVFYIDRITKKALKNAIWA